jgi:predicted DsbA family dithiol-disulfide isomerase
VLIDIYADLSCPWCYVGTHRLNRALALRSWVPADLQWQPFQLNPSMAAEGMDRHAYLTLKFGSLERARRLSASVVEACEREGLAVSLDSIRRTPNTLDAHRLIRYAARVGAGPIALAQRLMESYLARGMDIGHRPTLAQIAAEHGMNGEAVGTFLAGGDETHTVIALDNLARHRGITGVPCFVFDRRYAIAGAEEPEAFMPLFDVMEAEAATRRTSSAE